MRAAMVMMASMALVGCDLGDVGGPEPTSCELAAQHVAGCLGASEMAVSGDCDAQAAAQAEAVLQRQCSELLPAGERTPMSLSNLLCSLLPFLCPNNNGNGGNPGQPAPGQPAAQPDIFRIGDCWSEPQHGFCYDIVKINAKDNCTEMLERPEWQLPQYTRYQCLQPDGARCRLVRVCQPFQDKGQCVGSVPHHDDQAKCQVADQPQPGDPAPQPGAGSCNSDSQCGGGICYHNHTCIPQHSQPHGASCQTASGAFAAAVCQPGLVCRMTFNNGQTSSECAPPSSWP